MYIPYIPPTSQIRSARYILRPMKPIFLKLDSEVHAAWKAAADSAKLSLSEWIRQQCNRALLNREDHGTDRSEDLRGDETVHEDSGRFVDLFRRTTSDPLPTPVRSPRTATEATLRHDRRARPRTSGTLRQIEDVAHGTARKHGVGPADASVSVGDIPERTTTPESVTAENVPEIARGLSKSKVAQGQVAKKPCGICGLLFCKGHAKKK
jgi:hypothetical protein